MKHQEAWVWGHCTGPGGDDTQAGVPLPGGYSPRAYRAETEARDFDGSDYIEREQGRHRVTSLDLWTRNIPPVLRRRPM